MSMERYFHENSHRTKNAYSNLSISLCWIIKIDLLASTLNGNCCHVIQSNEKLKLGIDKMLFIGLFQLGTLYAINSSNVSDLVYVVHQWFILWFAKQFLFLANSSLCCTMIHFDNIINEVILILAICYYSTCEVCLFPICIAFRSCLFYVSFSFFLTSKVHIWCMCDFFVWFRIWGQIYF